MALRLIPIAAACVLLAAVSRFYDPANGFTELIGFGARFSARTVPAIAAVPRHITPGAGYDGQFYAQMATDPLLRDAATDRAMDLAPLRARRILFSWTAWVLGLGRPAWILQAYALQNVLAWLLLGWLLCRWFPPVNVRMVALWLATMFSGGLIWSVRLSLLDGPSLALMAAGVAAVETGRTWMAAGVFGIAGLARETSVLAVTTLMPDTTRWRACRRFAGVALVIALPLCLWYDYIYSIFRSTLFTSGDTVSAPLAGLAWKAPRVIGDIASMGVSSLLRPSALTLLALVVQIATIIARPAWSSPWWRLGACYAALLLVLGRPLWAGEPPTTMRVLLPLMVAFNVQLRHIDDPRWFWALLVAGNLTVLRAPALLSLS